MSYYSDQADLFLQTATDLRKRLETDGKTLDDPTWDALDKQREDLLNNANDMLTQDVQTQLGQLKTVDRPRLTRATLSLNATVKTIKDFDRIAAIATAGINLAVALVAVNPSGILNGIVDVEKAVTDTVSPPAPSTNPQPAITGLAIAASAATPATKSSLKKKKR